MKYRRSLARFRRGLPPHLTWIQALPWRAGFTYWIFPLLIASILFYAVPMAWMNRRLRQVAEPMAYRALEEMQRMEGHWTAPPKVPPFKTGREKQVIQWLQREPLLLALVNTETRIIWLREGSCLTKIPPESSFLPVQRWLRHAEASGQKPWTLSDGENPAPAKTTAILTESYPWQALRVWSIGSPEVESFAQQVLGPSPIIRVGLRRKIREERPPVLQDQNQDTTSKLQKAFTQGKASMVELKSSSDAFGQGWELAGVPGPEQEKTLRTIFLSALKESLIFVSLLCSLWWLTLFLRYRARRKERLERDRFASLAHSLKTPLSVLKLRCDSIRLGQLEPIQAQAQLLKLGEEADQLSKMIEQSLRSFGSKHPANPRERVDSAWIQNLAEELRTAFEAEGRKLRVTLTEHPGRAHPPSLRVALVTILENALLYGEGSVDLRTGKRGGKLSIQVRNEGPALNQDQLRQIGRPFFRFRAPEAEGFRREGCGLGIYLLIHLAEQEGWGFHLASVPNQSFQATLEIHT